MPTEAGLHVPLVILGPEKWIKTKDRNDLDYSRCLSYDFELGNCLRNGLKVKFIW